MTSTRKKDLTWREVIWLLLGFFGSLAILVGFAAFMKYLIPPTQSSIREKEALKLLERIVRVVESRSDTCSLIDGIFD